MGGQSILCLECVAMCQAPHITNFYKVFVSFKKKKNWKKKKREKKESKTLEYLYLKGGVGWKILAESHDFHSYTAEIISNLGDFSCLSTLHKIKDKCSC